VHGSSTEGFPTPVTAKLAGVTVDMLDNWHRSGFLSPSISASPSHGISRVYNFRDVVAIRVACEFRDAGISLQALRRVVKYLRGRKGLSTTEVLASTTLITDGRDVFEVEGAMTVSALRRPGQRVLFVVPLDELVTELQVKARALRAA
jgi:DNA-binding transcriptional MerR regulator